MKLAKEDLDYIAMCWADRISEACLNGVEWGLYGKRKVLPRNDGKIDEKWLKQFLDMQFTHKEEEIAEIGTSRDEVHIGQFSKICLAKFEKDKNQKKGCSDIRFAYTDFRPQYDNMVASLKQLSKSKVVYKVQA